MSRTSRLIFAIHSWLGLIAGIFVLSFFITGAVIVFREELNHWQHPHLFRVPASGSFLPYDSLYKSAQSQAPDLYLYSFRYIPKQPGETIEMRVYNPGTKKYGLLYLNPYNGVLLGNTWNNSIYDVLITLHYTFFMGAVGELLAGIFALALLGSIITGLIVYRKHFIRVFSFRMKMHWRNWRMISSNMHRVIGVWSLLFNLLLAFSGFYMMLYAFDLKQQFGSNASRSVALPPKFQINLDDAIKNAELLLRQGKFRYMDFPRNEGEPVTVYTSGGFWLWGDYNNKVEFNTASGKVERVFRQQQMSAFEKFEYAMYTLHYGQYGGMAVKVTYSVFGFAGSILSVTGFILWYRKKQTHARPRDRST